MDRFVSDTDSIVLKRFKVTVVPGDAKPYKNAREGFKLEKLTEFYSLGRAYSSVGPTAPPENYFTQRGSSQLKAERNEFTKM